VELETVHQPIVGGTPDSGHPAVGAVVMNFFLCSGTLVSPKIVLTAAHCVLPNDPIKKISLGPSTNQATEILSVSKVIPHPQYGQQVVDGWTLNIHDIAVVVLSSAAKTTPMKYRTTSINGMEGAPVTFVGFGVTVPGNSGTTGTKMKVASSIGKVNAHGFFNYTTPGNPKNTCTGDSGGPAILNQGGVDEVISVVSGGDEGCVKDGFNTRVDVHASWIQGLIQQYDGGGADPVCGNGICETGENAGNCAFDCSGGGACGEVSFEGCCTGEVLKWCENDQVNEMDCAAAGKPSCGWNAGANFYDCGTDGAADPSGTHPKECGGGGPGPVCGNGTCESGESESSCPADCGGGAGDCGDGVCGSGENFNSCAADCLQNDCGQHTFAGCCLGELVKWCEAGQLKMINCETNASCGWNADGGFYDCGTDGGSDASGQNPKACPGGSSPVCGNGSCEQGETSESCPGDCGSGTAVCGNSLCEEGENAQSCPGDCGSAGPVCGDGTCDEGESLLTCPADCATGPTCGDGVCGVGEDENSCPGDCGSSGDPVCGDDKCETGETSKSCPADCEEEVPPDPCGDRACADDETCFTCPVDCGGCDDEGGGGGDGCSMSHAPQPGRSAAWALLLLATLALLLLTRRHLSEIRNSPE